MTKKTLNTQIEQLQDGLDSQEKIADTKSKRTYTL